MTTPARVDAIRPPAVPPRPKTRLTPAEYDRILRLRETHTITQTAILTGRSAEAISRVAPHQAPGTHQPTRTTFRCHRCRVYRPFTDYGPASNVCDPCLEADPKLPAEPLVAVIDRYMRLEDCVLSEVCALIRQKERTLMFWRTGGRDVTLAAATEALFALDRYWWDAYNEDSVVYYRINEPIYAMRRKLVSGKWGLYKERVARRREDPQGTDWATLARCMWAFDPYEAIMRLRKRLDLPYGQVADLCGVTERRVRDVIVAAHAYKLDAAA